MSYGGHFLGEVIELDEKSGKKRAKFQLLKTGEWSHPKAPSGKLVITQERLDTLYENFVKGIRGKELPTNQDHDDPTFKRSPAWVVEMIKEDGALHGVFEFTDEDLYEDVRKKKVKYVSPELQFNWHNPADDKTYDVMKGVAFTNIPYIKGMSPGEVLNLNEVIENDPEYFNENATENEGSDSKETTPKEKPPTVVLADLREVDQDQDPDNDEGNEDQENDSAHLPSEAQDPDAEDPNLPMQCNSCQKLSEGSCPFQGIDVKIAAAGDGNCPQYLSSQTQLTPDRTSQDDNGKGGGDVHFNEETIMENHENDNLKEIEMMKQQIAQLSDTVTSLVSEKEKLLADNVSLSERVSLTEKERAAEAKLRADAEDRNLVDSFINKGKLSPHQGEVVLNILAVGRGEEIHLSESSEPASVAVLLSQFIEGLEQQVPLSEREEVHNTPKSGKTINDLYPKMEEKAKELAKEKGGEWKAHLSEAARLVTREAVEKR